MQHDPNNPPRKGRPDPLGRENILPMRDAVRAQQAMSNRPDDDTTKRMSDARTNPFIQWLTQAPPAHVLLNDSSARDRPAKQIGAILHQSYIARIVSLGGNRAAPFVLPAIAFELLVEANIMAHALPVQLFYEMLMLGMDRIDPDAERAILSYGSLQQMETVERVQQGDASAVAMTSIVGLLRATECSIVLHGILSCQALGMVFPGLRWTHSLGLVSTAVNDTQVCMMGSDPRSPRTLIVHGGQALARFDDDGESHAMNYDLTERVFVLPMAWSMQPQAVIAVEKGREVHDIAVQHGEEGYGVRGDLIRQHSLTEDAEMLGATLTGNPGTLWAQPHHAVTIERTVETFAHPAVGQLLNDASKRLAAIAADEAGYDGGEILSKNKRP